MILCFPDLDTFRLAATGTLLPVEFALAPARIRFEPDGRIFVETDAKVSKKLAAELSLLRVTGSKAMPGPAESISCWLQAIGAERDETPPLSTQAPVIFEVPDPASLPQLVGEMLRLGNDRQSYCWLETEGARRVLLRVVGPPYYTLLQSLDPKVSGSVQTLTAFVEQGPCVWVQIGYRHPAAGRIKLVEGQMLLIRPERKWTYLDEPPFRDIYSALQFSLPAAESVWQPVPEPEKLTVPLKLAPGNASEAPEFWVLRDDAESRLDAFVRDADDRLLQRLRFAVSAPADGAESVIALRLSPSKLPHPVLDIPDAVGYKPYFKLPNLFLPTGTRLHPQLRRDAVRTLLADDPDRVVWLAPSPGGEFVPESISEDAFRPLDHWVDHVLESSPVPLHAWVAATRFDFEPFVCSDTPVKPRGSDRGPKERGRGKEIDGHSPLLPDTAPTAADPNATRFAVAAAKPVDEGGRIDEWKLRRQLLQDKFLKFDGGLDRPERQALWPALARANAGAGDAAEAAICWVNAMWDRESPDAELVLGWFRSEHGPHIAEPGAEELDILLRSQNPDRIEVRRAAGAVLAAATRDPTPEWLRPRLRAILQYLEANDGKLPVRAVWLLAVEVAALSKSDVLGLARVRDRILQRLLDSGLNAETDLPFFLRTAGLQDSERVRLVRDRAVLLHQSCRQWVENATLAIWIHPYKKREDNPTLPYVDLVFAFGFAKLGESSAARRLIAEARVGTDLAQKADAHMYTRKHVTETYIYRIEEALSGKVPSRTFPRELVSSIDALAADGKNIDTPHSKATYAIINLRGQSMILEPQEKYDRFGRTPMDGDDFIQGLRALSDQRNSAEFMRQVRILYRGGVAGREIRPLSLVQLRTLHAAMPWAIRAGETFTVELLNLVPDALLQSIAQNAVSDLSKYQGELLERSVFLASHFDRRELVQRLLVQFVDIVATKKPDQRFELVNHAAQQCVRGLRRLGMRDEIDKLLQRLYHLVLEGGTLGQLKMRLISKPHEWARALQALLGLAGGWQYFGNSDLAEPILEEARLELLAPAKPSGSSLAALIPVFYTKLAKSYIAAVGQGSTESGLARLFEFFRDMDPKRLTIGGTNAQFYSEQHLAIVEEVVLAIASDDFALGPGGRRWLDEDEFLVRRRIHRDMQSALNQSRL